MINTTFNSPIIRPQDTVAFSQFSDSYLPIDMYVKLVLALIVLCAVISNIKSEKIYDERPFMQGYTRIKRGKYNSSPQRFYSRPVYSRPKVSASKRPTNERLGEEDINNIVRSLSKQDLHKIINLAGGNGKNRGYSKDTFENYNDYSRPLNDFRQSDLQDLDSDKYSVIPIRDEDSKLFKTLIQEINTDPKFSAPLQEPKPFNIEYSNPTKPSVSFATQPTPLAYYTDLQNNNVYDAAALAAEESMLKKQIAYLQSQVNDGVVYTDSKTMPEENLPKPMNLREEQDYDVSYTNNVPTFVKADQSSSYKLENFGELPLMNYNSKLDTLSSYHVPHYTVTSSRPAIHSSPPLEIPPPLLKYGVNTPSLEPAPPPSAAKSQSDAHLKAVRIWSHKSKGAAYTLNNDGSLSLERPGKPKPSYGIP